MFSRACRAQEFSVHVRVLVGLPLPFTLSPRPAPQAPRASCRPVRAQRRAVDGAAVADRVVESSRKGQELIDTTVLNLELNIYKTG